MPLFLGRKHERGWCSLSCAWAVVSYGCIALAMGPLFLQNHLDAQSVALCLRCTHARLLVGDSCALAESTLEEWASHEAANKSQAMEKILRLVAN